jgi:hypothetical protein
MTSPQSNFSAFNILRLQRSEITGDQFIEFRGGANQEFRKDHTIESTQII